jgi:hypothetical protein
MPAAARRPPTRRAVVAAATLVVLLAAAGCSGDSDGTTAPGSKGERTQVSLGNAATTEVTKPTEPTTAPPDIPATTGRPTPAEAALRLYDTWKANDRPSAAEVADPGAIDGMWATAPGDYTLYNKCDTAEFGTSGCLYRGTPRSLGTIQFNMEKRGALWVVIDAVYIPA